MKKIIDISWPLSEKTTAYKNKKSIAFDRTKRFESDGARESKICLGAHSGTHVDAPAHFLQNGEMIDRLELSKLVGKAKVLDLTDMSEGIGRDDLAQHDIQKNDIILLKTKNSSYGVDDLFHPEFVYLTAQGAQYLVEREIACVGIDYLGIERSQPQHETHTQLMEAGIVIVEGLRLDQVDPGEYQFMCLPLRILGLEAAPARAILIQ